MWSIIGLFIGGVACCAVMAFIGAVVLQASAKIVNKEALDYDRVYATAFYSALAMFLIAFGLGLAFSGPLVSEAQESFSRAKSLDPSGWERDPKASGVEAVLGWGAAGPVHVRVQALAVLLSVAAWIIILRSRHSVDLLKGVLMVVVSQVIWTVVIAAAWGVWVGIAAIYHAVEG